MIAKNNCTRKVFLFLYALLFNTFLYFINTNAETYELLLDDSKTLMIVSYCDPECSIRKTHTYINGATQEKINNLNFILDCRKKIGRRVAFELDVLRSSSQEINLKTIFYHISSLNYYDNPQKGVNSWEPAHPENPESTVFYPNCEETDKCRYLMLVEMIEPPPYDSSCIYECIIPDDVNWVFRILPDNTLNRIGEDADLVFEDLLRIKQCRDNVSLQRTESSLKSKFGTRVLKMILNRGLNEGKQMEETFR